MKEVALEIVRFTRKHSHAGFLISLGLLLVGLIAFNFTYDFEDSVIDSYTGSWLKGLWMFLYNGGPYLIAGLLLTVFGLQTDWYKKSGFWLHFVLGFAILAFDRSWYLWSYLHDQFHPAEVRFMYKIISSGKSLISAVLPLMLVYLILERSGKKEFYGLHLKHFPYSTYFGILGVALVFIFIGGFFGDIQEYYPRYLNSGGKVFAAHRSMDEAWAVTLYEFFYGLDFISTELFFRGFLILGMYKYFGPYVVYPMIVSYCVLHFGKPMTEAISSIFGGYILGIIALHHRNIWGGVIIHVGVAWGMEVIGYLHRVI